MSGNHNGGIKAAKKNKLKYGADFYARIGRKGGSNGNTGGFYQNRELAREAGAKGGKRSKRGPAKLYPGEIRVAYSAGITAIPITVIPLNFWGRMRRLWKTL